MRNYHIGCGYMAGKSWINYDSSPIAFFDIIPILNLIFNFNKKNFQKKLNMEIL